MEDYNDLKLAQYEFLRAVENVQKHFKDLLDYSFPLGQDEFEILKSEIIEVRQAGDYLEMVIHHEEDKRKDKEF